MNHDESVISDPGTHSFKLRQTLMIAVPVAVLCALQYSRNGVQPRPVASLLILLVVGLLVTYTVRRKFWFLADEVALDDVALSARRGGLRVSLDPADIDDIVAVPYNLRHAVALRLRSSVAPFGARVVFLPLGWRHSTREQVEQLVALLKSRLGA
jgi:hypothetical protein